MSPSEYEKLLIQEQTRRRKELEGLMGRSVFDVATAMSAIVAQQRHIAAHMLQPLLNSLRMAAVPAAMFQRSLLDSIDATKAATFQNIFTGVDRAARESIARTIAGINAYAMVTLRHNAVNTLVAFADSTVHRNALASITGLSAAFPKDTLERTAQAIAEAQRINLSKLGAISGSAVLAALDYSKFSPDIVQVRAIQSSFSGQMAAALREMLAAGPITEDTAKPVLELIDSRIESPQKGRISAEGLLSLLIALLAVLISYSDFQFNAEQASNSDKVASTREQQLNEISSLLRQIVKRTEWEQLEQDKSIYYLVEREVIIRLKPMTKSSQVALLFPSQNVRLVQKRHQWIRVEYFDYIEGSPKYGWAYKKYLKHIPRTSRQGTHFRQERTYSQDSSGILTPQERLAITDNWELTNARRVELINKKVKNNITSDETSELDNLQRLTDERIRSIAPLPIKELRSALEDINRREP